jgi:hypothetical protein
MVGGRFQVIPQKSQSERFVENIYALSILLLLFMVIAAFYITNIMRFPNTGTLIFLLYQSSFFIIFLMALVFGFVQGKYIERHRLFVKLMRISMLVFAVYAWFILGVWDSFRDLLPIEVACFVFLNLIEVFILEIHNMAFSISSPSNTC